MPLTKSRCLAPQSRAVACVSSRECTDECLSYVAFEQCFDLLLNGLRLHQQSLVDGESSHPTGTLYHGILSGSGKAS